MPHLQGAGEELRFREGFHREDGPRAGPETDRCRARCCSGPGASRTPAEEGWPPTRWPATAAWPRGLGRCPAATSLLAHPDHFARRRCQRRCRAAIRGGMRPGARCSRPHRSSGQRLTPAPERLAPRCDAGFTSKSVNALLNPIEKPNDRIVQDRPMATGKWSRTITTASMRERRDRTRPSNSKPASLLPEQAVLRISSQPLVC